ncbi:Regulatory protein TetR [Frankia sp. AiPs1]|uniref:TetR/AcrR family transcriptional regulator n=1 Tax=Frankia sp. AiPa1 TaxID=573492 RepID=UPI00202B2C9E|nr:TetR/AcrR family transcriptional regulator [Frankia sp. AiPa1]MCL9760551.1 TetR/AcrR family transcriptional regulator [Frankia sp. AiPa1]
MTRTARRLATRPRRADGQRNYDAVLAAAREVFAVRGAAASLEDIANRAGVAIGTLYGHFPSREALIEAATRDGLAKLVTYAEQAAEFGPPDRALLGWLRRAVEYCSTYRGMVEVVIRGKHDENALHDACEAMFRCGADLLRAAQAGGRVRADLDPVELFDLISAAAWVRETSPPGRDGSIRLLALLEDALLRQAPPPASLDPHPGQPAGRHE